MKAFGITIISLALTTAVIGNAYYQKKQFYPSVVYITKSNPSMAVIYIQAFILVLLMGKLMRKVFFGQLRAAEFEHLMERSWYAITETCLAFTVFRDDFNPKFVALFTVLLFLKSFHWLADDRVDYMERSPVIGWLFHIRVLSLLAVLGMLDLHFIGHAYQSTITKGASVQLVFGFEYAILITMVVNIAIKYALHSVDLNSENPWDNKAVFLLYTELVIGFIKVLLYVSFVAIMVRIYTLPLFAFRPMYYTMRNFKKAFNDVILSRRAIRNMNTLYPDATTEELQAADNVCIICREEMTTASKKLPCNHIFHTSCLRSWFQRQQTCPTCRLNILRPAQPASQNRGGQAAGAAAAAAQQPGAGHAGDGPVPGVGQPGAPLQFQAGFMAANMFNFMDAAAAAAAAANLANNGGIQQPPTPLNNNNINNTGDGGGGSNGSGSSTSPSSSTAAAAATSSSAAVGNINTNAAATIGAGFGSHFVMPPLPPFPFMPFLTPPPMPPTNLRSLSLEELHQMEGNERINVEARIQCLKNIQIMLDAAVLMMQQYSAAAVLSSTFPMATTSVDTETTNNKKQQSSSSPPPPPPPPQQQQQESASTSPTTQNTAISKPSTSGTNGGITISANNNNSSNNIDNNSNKNNKVLTSLPLTTTSTTAAATATATISSNVVDSTSTVNGENDELRRRRLQHFEQQQQNQ